MHLAFIKYLFIPFLLIEIISCSRQVHKNEKQSIVPRNVYIITTTGMRPDHLSSYMYQSIQTVGLDYFAYDGIRFTRAFSTSTDSLPSHLSMFTGLDPTHNSIVETYRYFQTFTSSTLPVIENLPKMLRAKGYQTGAFAADPEIRSFVLRSGWFDTTYAGDSVLPSWQPSCDSNRVRLQATEFSLSNRNKPHFAFINFFEPTPPYEPPDPYNKHYPTHPYDGEIAAIDEQISHFVHMLKEYGIFERSILIFTAPYAENPEGVGRAGSLDDDNLKIPLMIVAPGSLPRHENYGAAVSLIDLYPTIAALLDWGPVKNIDGKSLFQKNNNQQVEHDFLFGASYFPAQLGTDPSWFAWNDGWEWFSNNGIVKREEGLSNASNPELLLKKQKLLREAFESKQTGARASVPPIAEGSILQLEEALIAARRGKFDDALEKLSNDQRLSETPFILNLRAELEYKLGRTNNSLATLHKAIQRSASPELVLALARMEISKQQVSAAESAFKKYQGNMSYDLYSIIAIVEISKGNLQQAQRDIDMALKLNPRSSEAHHQQGLIYFARGEFARAELPLRKSLQLQPDNKDTMLDLAAALAKLGKNDEVKRLCATVLVHSPTPELRERARDILAKAL